jgi:hypothetical protein
MDLWLSAEVPGASEVHSFYQKCPAFPWAAVIQTGLAEMQRKIAEIGLRVLAVSKMKSAQAPSDSMIEVTTESSDFSTAEIPDAVFAIPAGYRKVRR